jgi:HD superfamily phosphohydrolase
MAARGWPKFLHDSVHRLIAFEDCDCDRLLLDLINAREFQRLRRVKQLGFTETVFPGANHSRFAHCVGVLAMARLFVERVELLQGHKLGPKPKVVLLSAALLHDIGHGPFSHAFEKVTKDNHEARTVEIIEDSSTEVHKVLAAHDEGLPNEVARFFEKEPGSEGSDVPAYLADIVSSQLDADRFDYLLRDSYAAGVGYGDFDYRWLISHLHVDEGKSRFYLSSKALLAAEAYFFARYHMYRTVYFHKTTRAAEVMLKLLFKRYSALVKDKPLEESKAVVRDAPAEIVKAFSGKMALEEYLRLDDHSVTQFLKACESSEDSVLRKLGSGLLNRVYFKAVDATGAPPGKLLQFMEEVQQALSMKGLDGDYHFSRDIPADTPYKEYDPDAEVPNTQVYVEDSSSRPVEISKLSKPVEQLKQKYSLLRFYFPAELRDDINELASKILRSESNGV